MNDYGEAQFFLSGHQNASISFCESTEIVDHYFTFQKKQRQTIVGWISICLLCTVGNPAWSGTLDSLEPCTVGNPARSGRLHGREGCMVGKAAWSGSRDYTVFWGSPCYNVSVGLVPVPRKKLPSDHACCLVPQKRMPLGEQTLWCYILLTYKCISQISNILVWTIEDQSDILLLEAEHTESPMFMYYSNQTVSLFFSSSRIFSHIFSESFPNLESFPTSSRFQAHFNRRCNTFKARYWEAQFNLFLN